MKCAIGCGKSPAVGIANLKGNAASVVGLNGTYPLCMYHYTEALGGNWVNVTLEGWEWLPDHDPMLKDHPEPASIPVWGLTPYQPPPEGSLALRDLSSDHRKEIT